MRNLGNCYQFGTCMAKNMAEAGRWYQKGADAGEPGAMKNLGICYQYGTCMAKNMAEAGRRYQKAADAGEPTAMKNLGLGDAQKQLNRVLGFTDFGCLQDSRLHGHRLYRVDDRRITPAHPV